MSRCVDLDEKVTAQFYDQECEEWTMQTVTIEDVLDSVCDEYTVLPSAQPERKKGKWIAVTEDGDVYKRICSCCGREAFFQNDDPDELYDGGRYELSDFCPHCGADMREADDEGSD